MKILIIERSADGADFYAYTEDLEHHVTILHNGQRQHANHVDFEDTENECNLAYALAPGQWTSLLLNN